MPIDDYIFDAQVACIRAREKAEALGYPESVIAPIRVALTLLNRAQAVVRGQLPLAEGWPNGDARFR